MPATKPRGAAKARLKHLSAARRAEHERQLADQREKQDEAIAPRAQRHAVTSTPLSDAKVVEFAKHRYDAWCMRQAQEYDRYSLPPFDACPTRGVWLAEAQSILAGAGIIGPQSVLRGPRIERSGITFIRSNPVRNLLDRAKDRRPNSDLPRVTEYHLQATERLLRAHDMGGEGVGLGHSDYSRAGVRINPQTGYIPDSVINAITTQASAAEECARAKVWLGPVDFAPINALVLKGISFAIWAETRHTRRAEALGDLVRALDRLVEFYPSIHRRATAAGAENKAEAEKAAPPPRSAPVSPPEHQPATL